MKAIRNVLQKFFHLLKQVEEFFADTSFIFLIAFIITTPLFTLAMVHMILSFASPNHCMLHSRCVFLKTKKTICKVTKLHEKFVCKTHLHIFFFFLMETLVNWKRLYIMWCSKYELHDPNMSGINVLALKKKNAVWTILIFI